MLEGKQKTTHQWPLTGFAVASKSSRDVDANRVWCALFGRTFINIIASKSIARKAYMLRKTRKELGCGGAENQNGG